MVFAVPLSRKFTVGNLNAHGETLRIEASETERKAIAKAYDVPVIQRFVADFRLKPEGQAGLRLRGSLEVELERVCVISLETFPVKLREPVEMSFISERAASARLTELDELEVELDAEDPPEVIENGVIDLGVTACEFFALALDPYPKKPGITFAPGEAQTQEQSPFAVLAQLKGK